MFKYLFWQIRQLFAKFPDPESWKYRFLMWIYECKYGSADELDNIEFNETKKELNYDIDELWEPVFAFEDDPDTVLGYVNKFTGELRDVRDFIPLDDDPDSTT